MICMHKNLHFSMHNFVEIIVLLTYISCECQVVALICRSYGEEDDSNLKNFVEQNMLFWRAKTIFFLILFSF